MLEAIANLDRQRATDVLASAARRLALPRYTSDTGAQIAPDDPSVVALLEELKRKVTRRTDETDDKYLGRVGEKLSGAISDLLLSNTDIEKIRDRIGQKGALPSSLYRLFFTNHFMAQRKLFAIRQSHIENAVKNADLVQHLLPTISLETSGVSLFAQTPRIQGPPHTILVKCNRLGAGLWVEDEFDLHRTENPLGILAQFLGVFGVPVTIEGETGNPILRKVVQISDTGTLSVQSGPKEIYLQFPDRKGQNVEFIIFYSFYQQKYSDYLRRHNVNSEPVGDISTLTHFDSTMMTLREEL
jgi:hypothetical protein